VVFWLWAVLIIVVPPLVAGGLLLAALQMDFRWKSLLRREWRKT
jgi:hypothetical protein